MHREHLSISALPAWCKINNCTFFDVSVQDLGTAGYGVVTERALTSQDDTFDIPALLSVPSDLILSRESINEHAKVDHHFRQLLDVAGGKSLRGDALLFLLMQITITSRSHAQTVGVSNAWTEYVKMLPKFVPLPTLWTEEECVMLRGTSLEVALTAKAAALLREYESFRDATAGIPWCHKCWWENDALQPRDWNILDAWFRSRSLELPSAGEAMIPALDMVNHSSDPNSFYEPGRGDSVSLLLRPGSRLEAGTEVTISYGASKNPAEMLFSYGFIDDKIAERGLTLSLQPFPEDPLGRAKAAAFVGPPVVRLFAGAEGMEWDSPFLYLLCLNEEDGLDFKVLQENDGSQSSLRTFWQDTDVTNVTNTFESLIENHNLRDIFKLRAVALLQDRIQEQLERLNESEEMIAALADEVHLDIEHQKYAILLREDERTLLADGLRRVEKQKNELLKSEAVVDYLASVEEDQPEHPEDDEASNDDDFS